MAYLLQFMLDALLLLLPAAAANATPVLVKSVPLFNTSIDGGFTLGGERLFGKNKTWRGLILGILVAMLVAMLQHGDVGAYKLGFLLGTGALLGDLTGSFIKRRFHFKPGQSFVVLDQIDWVLGSLLFLQLQTKTSWFIMALAIVLYGLLHPIFNLLGYYLKLKKNKF